jgi:hypothetical protein
LERQVSKEVEVWERVVEGEVWEAWEAWADVAA